MNAVVYAVFAAFAVSHAWIFFRDRSLATIKVVSSAATVVLIALLSTSFSTWLGWPAGAPAPHVKYAVLAVDIIEPAPDRAGRIYVWLSSPPESGSLNPFTYAGKPGDPRVYEVPFTPEAEKAMQRAGKAIREGHSVSAQFGGDEGADGAEGTPGRPGAPGIVPGQSGGDSQHLNGQDSTAPRFFIDEPGSNPLPPKQ